MKAKITSKTDNELTLLCSNNTFKVGDSVIIEDATKKTLQQLRFIHPLITIFIKSGCCSYDGDFQQIKDYLKRDIGAGFESYFYTDDDLSVVKVKNFEDIPEHIQKDKRRIMGKLKSMSNYTKKELMNMISNLIDMMINAGVGGKDFDSILQEFYNV